MDTDLKNQVAKSLTWVGSVNLLSQLLSWGMTIVVVRHLSPSDFGIMAMASVFIGFLTLIGDFGFFGSIVQRKEISHGELQEISGFILVVGVCFFLITFCGAPLAGAFYTENRIVPIIKTLSFVFLLIPLYVIPHSLLLREMNFRKSSIIDMCCNLCAGTVSMFFALTGYGVWALVYSAISVFGARAILFLATSKTLFKPVFGIGQIKGMLSFSGFYTASTVLRYFFFKSDLLIGGKFLGSGAIGLYSVANQLAFTPLEKISGILPQVAFPAFSKLQGDVEKLAIYFLKGLKLLNLILIPSYIGIAILAPDIVRVLLGQKWESLVEPIRILSLIMPLRAMDILFIPGMNGLGKSKINALMHGFAMLVMSCSFIVGVKWGYIGLCWAWVIGFTVVYIFMVGLCCRYFLITFRAFLSSYTTPLICGIAAAISSFFVLKGFGDTSHTLGKMLIIVVVSFLSTLVTVCCIDRQMVWEVKKLFSRRAKPA